MIELFDYQKPGVEAAIDALEEQRLFILAWDVGLGKTIGALELARQMDFEKVLVIAPKTILSQWHNDSRLVGLEPDDIVNPEKLRTGKTKWVKKHSKTKWEWTNLGDDALVIVDEAHRFGGMDSQLAYMLTYLKHLPGVRILMLSATIAENPLRLRSLLSLAELVKWQNYTRFCLNHGCYRDQSINGAPWRFTKGKAARAHMADINAMLFPKFGVRLTTDEIPDYPDRVDEVQLLNPSASALKEINRIYDEMADVIKDPNHKKNENKMTVLLRHRQKIELEKVPLFVEEAYDLITENHRSVAAFFSFRESLDRYAKMLGEKLNATIPEIHGGQNNRERDAAKAAFQSNTSPAIAVLTQAGGVGLSLGDERGERERVSLINPPLTATDLLQALGRIHRATNKSPALNKVILAAGNEFEEYMYRSLRSKLSSMRTLQGDVDDDDLNPF